jgi:hypothetical protein
MRAVAAIAKHAEASGPPRSLALFLPPEVLNDRSRPNLCGQVAHMCDPARVQISPIVFVLLNFRSLSQRMASVSGFFHHAIDK